MEIRHISVKKIRPDPNQPRKTFNDDDIKGMSLSIRTEGVINPIEIDKEFIIVTGELRWRAAKKAGLTEVPCKIISISGKERFRRQVIENIHHNTMNSYDTAVAIRKLMDDFGEMRHFTSKKNDNRMKGQRYIAKMIGKSQFFVLSMLRVLNEPEEIQKKIQSGELAGSFIEVIHGVPEKYRDRVREKMMKGEFKTRDAGRAMIVAMRRSPENAEKILSLDFSKFETGPQAVEALMPYAPTMSRIFDEGAKRPKTLGKIVEELVSWLRENPPVDIGEFHARAVVTSLVAVREEIGEWLQGQKKLK